MKWIVVVLVLLVSVASSAQEKLLVTTYRYADNDRLKNIRPLADYLANTCGCKTETKSYESVGAMLKGMEQNEPQLVLMNTFGYLLSPKEGAYKPVAALRVAEGKKSTYQSVVVANKATGLTTLEALKEQASSLRLLLVNPGSTSGNLVPRLGFASIGLIDADQAFKEVAYSKNHGLTLKRVAEGQADVGAFGREEYDKLLVAEPSLAQKVNVLWTSQDIPLGPVVVHKEVSKKLRSCIEETLLSLHEKNAIALEAVKGGWTEAIPADRYIRIAGKDYENWLKKNGSRETSIAIIQKFMN